MAGEETGTGKEHSLALETGVSKSTTTSATFERDGTTKTTSVEGEVTSFEDGAGLPQVEDDKAATKEEVEPKGDTETKADEATDADPDAGEAPEDLGAWDPANEEAAAKFDARYFTETEGEPVLNMDALTSEWERNAANLKDGEEPGLNEATYGFLKDRLGLSKEAVKRVEAGQVALRETNTNAFLTKVGGLETYDAAVEWGKANYSKADIERYRAAHKKGGTEFEEQAELLVARFQKAGGKVPETPAQRTNRLGPPRRAASPTRDATAGADTAAPKGTVGFADEAAHRAALKEAGDNPQKRAEVTAKLRASKWFAARKG